MELQQHSKSLKHLWEARKKRGLLPVLEEMNDLLDKGIITADDFAELMAGDGTEVVDNPSPAPKRWKGSVNSSPCRWLLRPQWL